MCVYVCVHVCGCVFVRVCVRAHVCMWESVGECVCVCVLRKGGGGWVCGGVCACVGVWGEQRGQERKSMKVYQT